MVSRIIIIIVFLVFLVPSCSWKDERMYPVGPGVEASLVVYFNADVNDKQIESFLHETFMSAAPDGHGFIHKRGVGTILRVEDVQQHKAVAVTFFEDATQAEREEIKSAIHGSPIVHKILENVAPKDVRTID